MYQPFRRLFPLLVLLVLFTGCTIEKRLYTKGWSVERRHVHRMSAIEEQRSTETAAMPVTADLPVEQILPPSPETLSQPETDNGVQPVAETKADSSVRKMEEVPVTVSEEIRLATDPKVELQTSDDEKTANRRSTWIALGVIVVILAGLGLGLALIGLLEGGLAGFEMTFLTMILCCLVAEILGVILIRVNSRKLKQYNEDHPEHTKTKEKTPEEAAKIKRRGTIAMGVLAAAIVAIILALNFSLPVSKTR